MEVKGRLASVARGVGPSPLHRSPGSLSSSSFSPGNPQLSPLPRNPTVLGAAAGSARHPLTTSKNLLIGPSSVMLLVRGSLCPDSFSGTKPLWGTEPDPAPGDRDWSRTGWLENGLHRLCDLTRSSLYGEDRGRNRSRESERARDASHLRETLWLTGVDTLAACLCYGKQCF